MRSLILGLLIATLLTGCKTTQFVEVWTRHKEKNDYESDRNRLGYGQKYKTQHGTHKWGLRMHHFPLREQEDGNKIDEFETRYQFEW